MMAGQWARLPEPSAEVCEAGCELKYCAPIVEHLQCVSVRVQKRLLENAAALHPALVPLCTDVGVLIRPYLLLVGSQCRAEQPKEISLDLLVALEMLQQSTLIIDDILDRAQLRNGVGALWKTVGREQAICLGYELHLAGLKGIQSVPGPGGLAAVAELTSSLAKLYLGQRMDVSATPFKLPSYQAYFDLIAKTTGTFLESSIVAGALIARADRKAITALRAWAKPWGVAYQMRDDILDFFGEEVTGKKPLGDLREGKLRLPVILCAKTLALSDRRELLKDLAQAGTSARARQRVLKALVGCQAIVRAAQHVGELCSQACNQLSPALTRQQAYALAALTLLVSHFAIPAELHQVAKRARMR
jgi:geranylgeranyl pyrophosphate synthase